MHYFQSPDMVPFDLKVSLEGVEKTKYLESFTGTCSTCRNLFPRQQVMRKKSSLEGYHIGALLHLILCKIKESKAQSSHSASISYVVVHVSSYPHNTPKNFKIVSFKRQ